MKRILIVEDEKQMALSLKDNLEYEGYQVLIADDGVTGQEMAVKEQPDLIILDIMLPGRSGLEVCKSLRTRGIRVPVIMLTARQQESDRVLGLELGADDYITKPFSVLELMARVKAVLRRTAEPAGFPGTYQRIGRLHVQFEQYSAFDENGEVTLSPKEYDILKLLLKNQGKTVGRDQLLNKVWGYDVFPTTRTVDNFISRLRKKIEDDPGHPRHILTVYGLGYRLIL